jgi:hypothetical protein
MTATPSSRGDTPQAHESIGQKYGDDSEAWQGRATRPLTGWEKVSAGMGLSDKSGNTDLSDPKTLDAWLKLGLGGANLLNSIFGRRNVNQLSARDLQAQVASPSNNWSPLQQSWANNYFGAPVNVNRDRLHASEMRSPITPSRRYAEGGEVEGALAQLMQQGQPEQAFSGYVNGDDGGQADTVSANLSHGEYVFDADTVSALGDGNNARGAEILDEARRRIRAQKRAASPDEIPPAAAPFEDYLGAE